MGPGRAGVCGDGVIYVCTGIHMYIYIYMHIYIYIFIYILHRGKKTLNSLELTEKSGLLEHLTFFLRNRDHYTV